jgi:hypothetical protein
MACSEVDAAQKSSMLIEEGRCSFVDITDDAQYQEMRQQKKSSHQDAV